MKLVISKNLKTFKQMLSIIGSIGSETNMVLDETGMNMFVTTAGSVASKVTFDNSFFDEYTINDIEEKYGVFLNDLQEPLKRINKEVIIENNNGRINISSGGDKYTIPILEDVQTTINRLPEIEYKYNVSLTLKMLSDVVDKIRMTKGTVITFFEEDGVLKASSVNGMRKATVEITKSNGLSDRLPFGIDLLNPILLKDEVSIKLFLGKDKPLTVDYLKNNAHLIFVLAPRVGEEE